MRISPQKVESPPLLRSEGLPVGSPEADSPDEISASWLRRVTCRRCPVAAGGREGSKTWRDCPCKHDVIAMTFPEPLVEVGYGASETFLPRRVRGGYNIPAGGCIAKKLGLLRHHVLFGAVVVLIVDGEGRGVPVGKYHHNNKQLVQHHYTIEPIKRKTEEQTFIYSYMVCTSYTNINRKIITTLLSKLNAKSVDKAVHGLGIQTNTAIIMILLEQV